MGGCLPQFSNTVPAYSLNCAVTLPSSERGCATALACLSACTCPAYVYVGKFASPSPQLTSHLQHDSCFCTIACSFCGRAAAIKAVDRHKCKELVQHLQNEVDILQHLAPLQGRVVSQLLGHGEAWQGMLYFVATVLVEGSRYLGAVQPEPPHVQEAAVAALQQIHAAGVLHGDLRNENVRVVCACGSDVWGWMGGRGRLGDQLWINATTL